MTYRSDFSIFDAHPNLTYLDSAATAQKPASVIEAVRAFSATEYGTIHRGLYELSVNATEKYEAVRAQAARFIGGESDEIVFTRGTTEGLNMVANGLKKLIKPGDEIIVSALEHHANLLPWRQLGATVKYAPLTAEGNLDLHAFKTLVTGRTRIVALSLCSNVLGTVFPIASVKKILDQQGSDAFLIVDAAQAVAHFPVSVRELGCDFLAFSGHKMYGPSGTGILWGRRPLLDAMAPYQVGGDMVRSVSRDTVEWLDAPHRFEAGTPNIEGIIGLGAAFSYLESIGMETVAAHTARTTAYAIEKIRGAVHFLSEPDLRSGIVSFTVDGIHPHDLAEALGERDVCIRAGHHCAAPLHQELGIPASNRISVGIYTDEADIDAFCAALETAIADYHA